MRTTLKRGIAHGNGNGNGHGEGPLLFPPSPRSPVSIYRQPPPPPRRGGRLLAAVAGWSFLVLVVLVSGVAGGLYLWTHESVAALNARSPEVKRAQETLDIPLPGEPAVALVIGYDRRASDGANAPSRSDTLMLVRADPGEKTVSLLSFPRDMSAEVVCPGHATYVGKINEAYQRCGFRGSLETVKHITGLPINYIVTVNFRGFRQLVDKLGGVYLDIDRRYYNDQGGPGGYARINLQPGYQRLNGTKALDFVRFRHTDSDLVRVARQQQFVRALKEQLKSSMNGLNVAVKLPQVVKAITSNVEVGQGGGKDVDVDTVLSYATLALSLPPGHVFQSKIEGLTGYSSLTTSTANVRNAVQDFAHPDVEAPAKATAVALGQKAKLKAPPPRDTTVTVLNGSGVPGAAADASYLLSQRGYQMLLPPEGVLGNAPNGFGYFRSRVYYDPAQAKSRAAAEKVVNLFATADAQRMPGFIREVSNGAMLVAVTGTTFHGNLASSPVDRTPTKQPAAVSPGSAASLQLLRGIRDKVDFPLLVPTVIERSSWIDPERPVRRYWIDDGEDHLGVRLVYRMGGANRYWGVQMTNWNDAPALAGSSVARLIKGRRYYLYYSGSKLHMVVIRKGDATYWVVNTLNDDLSNETMLAIAKGLRPLASVK